MARLTLTLPRVSSPLFYERVAAVWHFDETSGNALDGLKRETLTATGTPGSVAGVLGNARSLVRSTPQYFAKTDDAVTSMGDISFAFSLWWQHQTQTGTPGDFALVSKYLSSGTNRGYKLQSFSGVIGVQMSSDGTNGAGKLVSLLGAATVNDVWTHYVFGFDKTAQLVKLYVNNVLYSTAHTGGAVDNTAAFEVGRGGADSLAADGYVDELILWKEYFPTANEVARLYNGGDGWRMPIG